MPFTLTRTFDLEHVRAETKELALTLRPMKGATWEHIGNFQTHAEALGKVLEQKAPPSNFIDPPVTGKTERIARSVGALCLYQIEEKP